jgi:hypothetical protein
MSASNISPVPVQPPLSVLFSRHRKASKPGIDKNHVEKILEIEADADFGVLRRGWVDAGRDPRRLSKCQCHPIERYLDVLGSLWLVYRRWNSIRKYGKASKSILSNVTDPDQYGLKKSPLNVSVRLFRSTSRSSRVPLQPRPSVRLRFRSFVSFPWVLNQTA